MVKRFSDQDDMVVIFDDTHRKAELETFHLLIKMLKNDDIWDENYKIKYINAMKSQACLIKGKNFLVLTIINFNLANETNFDILRKLISRNWTVLLDWKVPQMQ